MTQLSRAVVLMMLAATVVVGGAEADAIAMSVIANGGGGSSGGGVTLYGTAGQPAVGCGSAGNTSLCSGFWSGGALILVVGVDDELGVERPKALDLGLPTPNPIHGGTEFRLALPDPASVSLIVYDIAGRRVAVIAEGPMNAGVHRVHWTGVGPEGRHEESSLYLAVLRIGGRVVAKRKLVVIR